MIRNDKGIVFWITGLSGSGKSSLGKAIKNEIIKQYGPTILFNGDDLRNLFQIKSYDKKSRFEISKQYSKFCKFIAKQKINIIFTSVSLFHDLHKFNRKNIPNYIEIYIKSDIKKLLRNKKKAFYKKKQTNVWGIDLKPEFPKKPNILINNNFKKNILDFKSDLIKKIYKILS